mgnify:CR=1 FL=1
MSPTTYPVPTLLDSVIGFMEEALQSDQTHQSKIAELRANLEQAKTDQQRVVLEKVAEAKAQVFDRQAMDVALTRLEGLGVIRSAGRAKLARQIESDPNVVFPLLVRVSQELLAAPGDGAGIEKEAAGSGEDEDPDGWDALITGRPVKLKR